MKENRILNVLGQVEDIYIDEAAPVKQAIKNNTPKVFFKRKIVAIVAACLALAIPITAYTVEVARYNAAVDYLTSLGIEVDDLSDYSRQKIKEAVRTIEAGKTDALTEEILSLSRNNKESVETPTQVTSEQIKALTPTMTRKDVIEALGDTQDIGSGIYVLVYEVDQKNLLNIPFAGDDAQLGVNGEKLLEALIPKK